MQKPKVFAKNINNLTDARYFAAMGVDFIGFELSASNAEAVQPNLVKQIKEWVAGPEIIGCFNGFETEQAIRELIRNADLDGLCFETFAPDSLIDSLNNELIFKEVKAQLIGDLTFNSNNNLIINYDEISELSMISSQFPEIFDFAVWLDGPMDLSFFESELLKQIEGIVLKGGDEEKTGFKSFDELDIIFEQIQQFD